jgi:hypothetical protein
MLCTEGPGEDQKESLRGNLQLPETMTSRPSAARGDKTAPDKKKHRKRKTAGAFQRSVLMNMSPLDGAVFVLLV